MEQQNILPIKTLADFKRGLVKGRKVGCIYHLEGNGRNEAGELQYKSVERPLREVSIVQSNSFAIKTEKTDGKIVDSWCQYPKASESKIENNRITMFEDDRKGNKIPVLTYWIVE